MLATFPDNVGQVTTPPPGFQPYITVKLDKPPLNDQRVRAALQHLIDVDAIIDGILEGMAGPGLAHDFSFFGFFGTDAIGRDVFSRVVYGARVSLLVGVAATLAGTINGTVMA